MMEWVLSFHLYTGKIVDGLFNEIASMPTITLVRTLNLAPSHLILFDIKKYGYSIHFLLDSIYLFPLSWRKLIISTARIQQSSKNIHLNSMYRSIQRTGDILLNTDHGPFDLNLLRKTLDNLYSFFPIMSYISYFARAETFHEGSNEPREIIDSGIQKELSASQQGDRPQALHYSFLDPDQDAPVHTGGVPCPNLSRVWNDGLRRLIGSELSGYVVLYPYFNTKKNLSYATQEALAFAKETTAQAVKYSFTAKDLFLHYLETGERILGPMEVRWSWKLGDLKIRTYYCTGGTEAFYGAYMHDLCILLYNILPSTNIFLRFDINRVTVVPLNYDEVLITYDYSSFTTSLSELKYALHYLGERLKGIKIPALDLHAGIFMLDVGEYMQQYNEIVNCNSAFDLSRIAPDSLVSILHQTRSGMLGAQGNIGLSTLLHGFSATGYDDIPQGKSIVGDDGLIKAKVNKIPDTIRYAKSLVDIAASKFSMWFRPDYDEEYTLEGFQYLKRPLSLNSFGAAEAGNLPDFPNVAAALGHVDEFRKGVIVATPFERIISFIKQYTRFLNSLELLEVKFPRPLVKIILRPIRHVYRYFGIPRDGMIPGHEFSSPMLEHNEVSFFIPSCRTRVLNKGWLETLFSDFRGEFTYIPKCVPKTNPIVAGYSAGYGDIFECTPIRVQNMLANLGFFSREVILEEIQLGEEGVFQKVKSYLKNEGRMVVRMYCIKELPVWYNACLDYTSVPLLHAACDGEIIDSRTIQDLLGYNFDLM